MHSQLDAFVKRKLFHFYGERQLCINSPACRSFFLSFPPIVHFTLATSHLVLLLRLSAKSFQADPSRIGTASIARQQLGDVPPAAGAIQNSCIV